MPKNGFPKLVQTHTVKVDDLFAVFEDEGKQYKQPVLFVIVSIWEDEFPLTGHGYETKYNSTFAPITMTDLREGYELDIGCNGGAASVSNFKGLINSQDEWVELDKKAFD